MDLELSLIISNNVVSQTIKFKLKKDNLINNVNILLIYTSNYIKTFIIA